MRQPRFCIRHGLQRVPAGLIGLRLLLGPVLYRLCVCRVAGGWIVAVLTLALLSDIFDGVIARRLNVATERLRVADSWADGFFYAWVVAAVCAVAPHVIRPLRGPLLLVLAMQGCSYGFDLLKYGRIASFHALSAKLWGIALFVATIALLGFHAGGIWLWPAIICGLTSNLEGFAMKLVLPTWTHDVKSLRHALRLRQLLYGQTT